MYIVGLTGGIGSGKTTAAARFAEHGVTIVNSDAIAREIVAAGSPALAEIVARYGSDLLTDEQELDRQALRKIVFNDQQERRWLEQLTHPMIAELTHQRLQAPQRADEPPYRILESPLLLESQQHEKVNCVLLVDIPHHQQIDRTTKRDNNDEALVRSIIDSQLPREHKQQRADYILDNSGDIEQLKHKVDELHQHFCDLAKQERATT